MTLIDFYPFYSDRIGGWDGGCNPAGSSLWTKAVRGKIKDSPYECGLAAEVGSSTRYSVKFYVTAMLFILFDIDVVLIPWVLTHRELTAAGVSLLWPMLFFTFVLAVGLIYELKSGALEWEK